MTAKRRLSADELRGVLRRGDPARGDRLTRDESSELRQRVLADRSTIASTWTFRGVPVTAVAVAIVALVVVTLLTGRPTQSRNAHAPVVASSRSVVNTRPNGQDSVQESASVASMPHDSGERAPRPGNASVQRVFVTTPGGTRIVWVLNPRFAL